MDAFEKFMMAVEQGQDDLTEQLVLGLSKADEPALIRLAGSINVDERWWAVRALAYCGQGASVPAVVHTLADMAADVRAVACLALAELYLRVPEGVRDHLSALGKCLADEEGFVRQSAVDGLAKCGDDAVETLASVLQSSHEGARTRAAVTLRKIASIGAAPLLYQYLNDSNYLVRTYCYEALDEMGLLDNILVTV